MAKIEDGTTGSILAAVDSPTNALLVQPRIRKGLGHYNFAGATGLLMALGANSEIFQFRWADAPSAAQITGLRVQATLTAAFTTAQEVVFDAFQTTGFTTAGSGGTQVLPAATSFKKDSAMPTSRLNEIRIATTNALVTGNRALSPHPFLSRSAWAGAVGASLIDLNIDLSASANEHPIILRQNEGIALRLGAIAMGSVGTFRMHVSLSWTEFLATEI